MWWKNNFCVRTTIPSLVTSLGVATDEDFKADLEKKVREAICLFRWGSYGLDYVAETLGDAEDWVDALTADIVYAVEETTQSWKEEQ